MNFVAIDVETANENYWSICQIGMAEFKGGKVCDTWVSLVNPQSEFRHINTSIHGICESDVVDAPCFTDLYDEICGRAGSKIAVHHGHFDRVAINQACDGCGLDYVNTTWLDSCRVARRTWDDMSYRGYGLSDAALYLGIDFQHHYALEDAIVAGRILSMACDITGLTVEEWIHRVEQPINNERHKKKLVANPDGHLYGEFVVFTGQLPSLSRRSAKEMASGAGCEIKTTVSGKTTMLVVGVQDKSKLRDGCDKSTKQRKAEGLIEKGKNIKILSENEFIRMVNQ